MAKAKKIGKVSKHIENRPNFIRTLIKALRIHQWLKNLLIFVPLAASHQVGNVELLIQVSLAFFFFGLCASSVYLLNDLLDLEDDRHHHTKRFRPFASGDLDIRLGIFLIPILIAIAVIGSLVFLPLTFLLVLSIYYVLTLAYSFVLKQKVLVDVVTLAVLYTIRIIAGAIALNLDLTFWILAFSMFIFLSLALVKRYAELFDAKLNEKTEARGRGYYPSDLEMLSSLGAASGYMSVMVLALYINEGATTQLYSHPSLIWLTCPILLYWVSRTWMLAHRGLMHDDPVVFAAKDRISQITGGLFLLCFWLAL